MSIPLQIGMLLCAIIQSRTDGHTHTLTDELYGACVRAGTLVVVRPPKGGKAMKQAVGGKGVGRRNQAK
uniref:Putative secreted protein n=1 Tax=Anopheles marajoara TaxID=58244 RepID=A0A2M4CFA3_9DIPT